MRAKRFEKVLEIKRKKVDKAINKIEQSYTFEKDSLYLNLDGTIDWERLAKHIKEATNGR
jgi:hypothetical protein